MFESALMRTADHLVVSFQCISHTSHAVVCGEVAHLREYLRLPIDAVAQPAQITGNVSAYLTRLSLFKTN